MLFYVNAPIYEVILPELIGCAPISKGGKVELLNIIIVMLVMINPYIAGVSSMILHLAAVVAGVIYILIDHKKFDVFFS